MIIIVWYTYLRWQLRNKFGKEEIYWLWYYISITYTN